MRHVAGPMLVHAAAERLRTGPANLRGIVILCGSQRERVEMPRSVVDEEAGTGQLAAVAIVNLAPHYISEMHLPAAKFGDWQRQAALRLVSGVIDDYGVAAAAGTGPG